MTDNEKLIEEAAATIAVAELVRTHRTWGDLIEPQKDEYRRVARATLSVFEKAHTTTDDEREALDYAIRCAIPNDLDYRPLWKLIRAIQDSVSAAGFRRSEVPSTEPTCEHGTPLSALCEYAAQYASGETDGPHPEHREPQGEPSDAEIEAARYRERLGDLEGADDEVLAHTRTIAERAQGEPSDAPTVQFMARKGGKSQTLIDQMLAQANDQGIRVEVVYPQGEPSDTQVDAAINAWWECKTDGPGGQGEAMRAALRAAGGVR